MATRRLGRNKQRLAAKIDGLTRGLRRAFDAMLAVSLGNTNGCSVTTAEAGLQVTFTAPASGASGTFSASGSNTVTVINPTAGSCD